MNEKIIALSSLQLLEVNLASLQCVKLNDPEEKDQSAFAYDMKIATKSDLLDSTNCHCFLKVIIGGKQMDELTNEMIRSIFNIEIELQGTLTFNGEYSTLTDKDQDEIEEATLPMLWPYAREIIHSTASRMGFPDVIIPTIDRTKVVNKTEGDSY